MTIRTRVTLVAATVTLVVLAAVGLGLLTLQRRALEASLEESLTVAAEAALDSGSLGAAVDDDFAGQIVEEGAVVAATGALGTDPLPGVDGTRRLTLESLEYLVVARADGGGRVVHAGAPLDDVAESLASLRLGLALILPPAVGALAAMAWWLVGRSLDPVEAIRAEVEAISAESLDRRVPAPPVEDEIGRLAGTMNRMLDRLEDGTARQRRFVSDASHELRTPLARMRSEIEVELAHPGPAPETALLRLQAETVGMQRLVEDLLLLARGQTSAPPAPVDLDDLVLGAIPPDPRPRIDLTDVSAAQVSGHPGELGRAIANLVDNAVRHAAATVWLAVGETDGRAVVTVTDDGPGIPPERRQLVFERFTRLDDAREADRGGSGLGLAIAREIVERHGGTLTVDDGPLGGARFTMSLPAG
jgi:signal transduction histidine kinase